MINKELQKLLRKFPADLEVKMEVNNIQTDPTDIDWEVGETSAWLVITDYPIEEKKENVKAITE